MKKKLLNSKIKIITICIILLFPLVLAQQVINLPPNGGGGSSDYSFQDYQRDVKAQKDSNIKLELTKEEGWIEIEECSQEEKDLTEAMQEYMSYCEHLTKQIRVLRLLVVLLGFILIILGVLWFREIYK